MKYFIITIVSIVTAIISVNGNNIVEIVTGLGTGSIVAVIATKYM